MARAAPAASAGAAPPRAAAEQDGGLAEILLVAQQHADRGEHVKAFKAFTRAVDEAPASEAACRGKVAALRQLGRPRGALKACELGLRSLPDCESLAACREELRAELGEEAEELIEEVQAGAEKASEATTDDDSDGSVRSADGAADDVAGCPASRSTRLAKRESQALGAQLRRRAGPPPDLAALRAAPSAAYRAALKDELVCFYRDFYARTRTDDKVQVDTTQYSKVEKEGLSIKDGHRHMPRPDSVDLPEDHKHVVGTLSAAELAEFSCFNPRLLLCIHGDLFDVSDRPDKYGPDGPYSSMAGHDITWALWAGYDDEAEWDKYFDVLQAQSAEERDRRFQGLMSWWAFFEQEYGEPVGRLDVYEREWELPPPPKVRELCTVM